MNDTNQTIQDPIDNCLFQNYYTRIKTRSRTFKYITKKLGEIEIISTTCTKIEIDRKKTKKTNQNI